MPPRSGQSHQNGTAQPSQVQEDRWRSADTIEAVEREWLLPGRVARGGLALVEGATSVGKSTWIAHLVASITTGRAWLGRHKQRPADVLWMSGEEDFGASIRPRLVAAAADLARVHAPRLDEHGEAQRHCLPGCVGLLRTAIEDLDLHLIVLEPLSSFVTPDADLNSVAAVRAILDPLQQMCMAAKCTTILTRGLRKDRSGPRSSHGQGSSAIGDAARCALVIDHPDPTRPRRVATAWKVSGGQLPSPVEYYLEPSELGPIMTGLRELTSAESIESESVSDLGERSAIEDARAMLRTMLTEDWLPMSVVLSACLACGISTATLRRAERQLGIQKKQIWDGQTNRWDWAAPVGGWCAGGVSPGGHEHQGTPPRKRRKKAAKLPTPDAQIP